jgi:hypothetical protein
MLIQKLILTSPERCTCHQKLSSVQQVRKISRTQFQQRLAVFLEDHFQYHPIKIFRKFSRNRQKSHYGLSKKFSVLDNYKKNEPKFATQIINFVEIIVFVNLTF